MTCWLSSEQALPFGHLTTASLAVALDGLVVPTAQAPMSTDALLAAGQSFAGLPAALAVVKLTPHDALEVISLAVAEPFRQLGLARQLLLWLQAQVQLLGCRSLSLSYPLGHFSTVAMERLTSGWQHSPGLRLVHLDRAGGSALVQRLAPLAARWQRSGRFALVRWQDMTADLQRRLERRQQQAPSWAWSATADAALGQRDALISQVLLDQDAVVGWLAAHRVGLSLSGPRNGGLHPNGRGGAWRWCCCARLLPTHSKQSRCINPAVSGLLLAVRRCCRSVVVTLNRWQAVFRPINACCGVVPDAGIRCCVSPR
jgi:hypothetical protein